MRNSLRFAMAAILALVMSTPSEAKSRPTVDSSEICWNVGSSDKGCEGLICYCCYNEGCWICNKDTYDCVWDPYYRDDKQPKGMTVIVPSHPAGIKPPWSKPPKGSTGQAPPPAGAKDQ